MLGYRSDVLSIVKQGDAFVLPSTIEGLPAVLLEAMFYRVPVIAYGVGGVPEIVRPGETGWLVQPGDEAGFEEAVIQALAPATVRDLQQIAYEMVCHDFDNRVIADRFLAVYNMVAGQ
jgi:glycosyltransferase involved in cell wall biosynthesis